MFKDVLKHLRKQKSVTQLQLAEAIGVSPGNVGDWENGKSHPNYKALISLSNFFGVSADYLLEQEQRAIMTQQEKELLTRLRAMELRDSEEIFDLAEFKYNRSQKKEA